MNADVAWAAGFLEGEGTFRAGTGTKLLSIDAHQVQLQPLERLQRVLGGKIYGPRFRKTPTGKDAQPCYIWYAFNEEADAAMSLLRSELSPKRQAQIDAAREARKVWLQTHKARAKRFSDYCIHGHPYSTVRSAERGGYRRICRVCATNRARTYRERKQVSH